MDEVEQLKMRVADLERMLSLLFHSDRYTFSKLIQIMDGRNIQTGRTTGTKIGTATDQLVGFYGNSPVNQPDTVSDPSGQTNDLDSEARTAINSLIDRLQELGLIA